MAQIIPVTCLAKTGKDQKAAWVAARASGEMKETEEDVIKLLSYEFLTGLDQTETGTELKNILHRAFSQCAELLDSKIKKESRKALYLEAISVLDAAVTNGDGGASSIFGKGILAQAARNLSGLKFIQKDTTATGSDSDEELVEAETL